jgi:hypothetical protein
MMDKILLETTKTTSLKHTLNGNLTRCTGSEHSLQIMRFHDTDNSEKGRARVVVRMAFPQGAQEYATERGPR